MRNVFISYHHANDQSYKDELIKFADQHKLFRDYSVNTGDLISDDMSDQIIRERIRDDYLRDSSVTIVLVGIETRKRKHVDWEIYSSMYNGKVNKQSGILVVNLPSVDCSFFTAGHGDLEKKFIYPENSSWISINTRADYEDRYPHMPPRIINNLIEPKAKISVVNWSKIYGYADKLSYLIEATAEDRSACEYDLSRAMMRANIA